MSQDLPRSALGLPFLWRAAQQIYPERTLGAHKNKFNLLRAALKSRPALRNFFAQPQHQALLDEWVAHPPMLGFTVWPYLHAEWPVMQRLEALSQHFQAMRSDMAALDVSRSGSLVVNDMSALMPGLRLVIDRAPWCLREGGLVFNQFLNDDRMMSLAFSFGMQDGERVAYIGSMQGSNAESALEKYKEIGKALHGMRSRDFVVKAFQLLSFHLGVQRVLCIADAQRHHRHPYFPQDKNETFHLNYDEIWAEHHAEPAPGGFFRLASLPAVRPMEEIAQKNRSLYRKRYAMMDALSAEFGQRFGSVKSRAAHPPVSETPAAAPAP